MIDSTFGALSDWFNPGIDPLYVGAFNVTVFDPDVHLKTRGRTRAHAVVTTLRYWNGENWSRPWTVGAKPAVVKAAMELPSLLIGDHARFWWRGVLQT